MPFLPGREDWCSLPTSITDDCFYVGQFPVMCESSRSVMQDSVGLAQVENADVLEIGYGKGICYQIIQYHNPISHTIIECHPKIAQDARDWAKRKRYNVVVVEDFWQNVLPEMDSGKFDVVMSDTFHVRWDEGLIPLIPHAARLLRPNGRFVPYTGMIQFDKDYLRAMLEQFASVDTHEVKTTPNAVYDCSQMTIAVGRR